MLMVYKNQYNPEEFISAFKLAANVLNQWRTVYFAVSRDVLKQNWHIVCRLKYNVVDDLYSFCYTCGAFNGVPWFLEQYPVFGDTYPFKELPDVFAQQMPDIRMFSHEQLSRWFGLPSHGSLVKILSVMGINQVNPQYQVVPEIVLDKFNRFSHIFFLQNLLPDCNEVVLRQLNINERLYLQCINQQNILRIKVLTSQNVPLGYLPWYLINPISEILAIDSGCLHLSVHGVNLDAPSQFRLRCYFQGQVPLGFNIRFSGSSEFIPVNQMPKGMQPYIIVR